METEYTRISKEIGITPPSILPIFPPLEEAKLLFEQSKTGDREAFKKLFNYWRFLPMAVTSQEKDVAYVLFQGFSETQHHFL